MVGSISSGLDWAADDEDSSQLWILNPGIFPVILDWVCYRGLKRVACNPLDSNSFGGPNF